MNFTFLFLSDSAIVVSTVTLEQSHFYATQPLAIRRANCAQLPNFVGVLAPVYNLKNSFVHRVLKQSRLRVLTLQKSWCY